MTRKCPPCGIEFIVHEAKQDRCADCTARAAREAKSDAKRYRRFDAKALDGWRPAA